MKLLVGYDGSEPARAAVSAAGTLAERLGARVTLLTALSTVSWVGKAVLPTAEPAEVLSAVSAAAELANRPGIDAEVQIEFGDPAIALKAVAEREVYDLIVVGHRGLGGVAGMMLGSVAKAIVTTAPCPVLIVRSPPPPTISRVLVAIDGSAHAQRAADTALSIARATGATATIVHVIDSGALVAANSPEIAKSLRQTLHDQGRQALARVEELCARRQVSCDTVQEEGRPAEVIGRLARTGEYDLVALGRRGLSGIARLVLGSVSDEVIRSVEVPILVAGEQVQGSSGRSPGT